jgi:hypothetical protein
MAYFRINGNDYSNCVSELKITNNAKYNAQTNAAGNTVVDLINNKKQIEVGIIPLTQNTMADLQSDLALFNVSIDYRNPQTNELEEGVNCIIPTSGVEYYTIQANKVMYKAMTLTFTEL